jgi:NAD(P)-dependent dehydrogenase (short-subunit alcohol dehydrogenase family)
MSVQHVLVTGGNSGIGLALCKQLVSDYDNIHVFLTSRNEQRGSAAVTEVEAEAKEADRGGSVDLVVLDVSSEESVTAAAEAVAKALGKDKLWAVVNNAGIGLSIKVAFGEIVDTNFHGPRRVVDAFLPLMDGEAGRIVNVGSGAGPMYVDKLGSSKEEQATRKLLLSGSVSYEDLAAAVEAGPPGRAGDNYAAYGFSKAALACYTRVLARAVEPRGAKGVLCSCITPGFIATKLVAGFGATKTPAEGTVAIRKCLFEDLPGNGHYYGSDGMRSQLWKLRSPGDPEYTGGGDDEQD